VTSDAPPSVLTLEELANGYCLFMANGYRLIEDGEKLLAARRPLGALGCFQQAAEELVRGHLLSEAVVLEDEDAAGWTRFWRDLSDRTRLLEILDAQIHPDIYRNEKSRERYERGAKLLPLEFVRIAFRSGRFDAPGGNLAGLPSVEDAARGYYEYVLGLFHAFNFYGLPNPATQIQTFWGLRVAARNQRLVR